MKARSLFGILILAYSSIVYADPPVGITIKFEGVGANRKPVLRYTADPTAGFEVIATNWDKLPEHEKIYHEKILRVAEARQALAREVAESSRQIAALLQQGHPPSELLPQVEAISSKRMSAFLEAEAALHDLNSDPRFALRNPSAPYIYHRSTDKLRRLPFDPMIEKESLLYQDFPALSEARATSNFSGNSLWRAMATLAGEASKAEIEALKSKHRPTALNPMQVERVFEPLARSQTLLIALERVETARQNLQSTKQTRAARASEETRCKISTDRSHPISLMGST